MIKSFFFWLFDHLAGTYVSLAILVLGIAGVSAAIVSYDVTNNPQMYLDVSITSTQTASIKLSALQRNGSEVTFPTTTGAILRIRQGFRVEDIHYTSATVSADKVVTLVGVTRDICWNQANLIITCGAGQSFSKGAIVELSVDARLLNFKVNKDRVNNFTGSGSLESSQTNQPFLFPNRVTTAQRDAFTYGTGSTKAPIIFNTTRGVSQNWNGTAWVDLLGSGATVIATTSVRGSVEVATTTDIINATSLGDSSAIVVLPASLVARSSSGSTQANKIAALGTNGRLSGSLLASGTATGNTFLRGDQTWAIPSSSFYFGTCADGDVSIGSGTTTTLTADKHYNNLTVYSGATLKPNGYRVFVCGTLEMKDVGSGPAARIIANGGNGGNGTNAVTITAGVGGVAGIKAGYAGTLPASQSGSLGGNGGAGLSGAGSTDGNVGTAGSDGTLETIGIGTGGLMGGRGGVGGPANAQAGGVAGAAGNTGSTLLSNINRMFNALITTVSWETSRTYGGSGGSGAGGGGGGGARDCGGACTTGAGGGGGGSGANGGNVDLYVNIFTGSGYIQVNAGNGGNGGNGGGCSSGTTGGGGAGGGGSGGSAGTLNIFYKAKSLFTGIIEARVGRGGSAGSVGSSGCNGSGTAGVAGKVGAPGALFQYQVR